jgi:hypothetical protein
MPLRVFDTRQTDESLPAPARIIVVLAAIACVLISARTAHAEAPKILCEHVGTDDTARPIPQDLVPAMNAAFAMRMPDREVMNTSVFRCAEGHVLVCTVGANLPCGKADTSRAPNPAIERWCRDNQDASVVPAAATGHDTIYEWRCSAGRPQIVRQTLHVDPRGFVAEFWKKLP